MAARGVLEARGAHRQVESGLNTLVRLGCLTDEQSVRLKGELNRLVDMASAGGAAPAAGPAGRAAPAAVVDPPGLDDLIDLGHGAATRSAAGPREGGGPGARSRYEGVELENSREWLAPDPAPRAAAAAPPGRRGLGDSRWTRPAGRDPPDPFDKQAAQRLRRQAPADRATVTASAAARTLSSSGGSPPPPPATGGSAAGLLVCPFWLAGKCRAAGPGGERHGGLVHAALGGLPVERLECPFWRDGDKCTKAAADCRYEHRATRHGRVAPYPHGLPGRARRGPGGYVGLAYPAELVGEGAVDSEVED